MSVITKNKAGPIDKTVALFSGGLDSFIISKIRQHEIDTLLYVQMGSDYEKRQEFANQLLIKDNFLNPYKLTVLNNVLNLKVFERDDFIVPNRNAHLVLLASMFGDEIILCSVYGDRSYDKDLNFLFKMKCLLNHMWQEQHWTKQRTFKIATPFKNITKTELVKTYLECKYHVNGLYLSFSCYSPGKDGRHCGWCKPCFRKWVALRCNGVDPHSSYWVNNPWKAPWLPDVLPLVEKGGYRGKKEDNEWLQALMAYKENNHEYKNSQH